MNVRDDNAEVPVSLRYEDWAAIMYVMEETANFADADGEYEYAEQCRRIYRAAGTVFGE